MGYESAVVLVIVFSIPAGILLMTRMIRLQQLKKTEQAELDLMFSTHQHDSNHFSV